MQQHDDRSLPPSRRQVMLGALAAGAVLTVGVDALRAADPARRAGLRVAHLTDMHLKPEAQQGEGFARALDSLRQLDPPPAFIVTGGDHVMDVMQTSRQRGDVQWDLYQKVLEQNTKLKVYPVIGNHDVFGWGSRNPTVPEDTPGYGKDMAMDRLGLSRSFYTFDAGGWKFIVLDNIARRGGGYYGELDAAQTEWLKGELQSAGGKPVCVFSHIPIASLCAFFFHYWRGETPKEFWRIGDNLMHRDSKPLIQLFSGHNVQLCVSGHIHLLDHVKFMGVEFICDGAVSGNWWHGPFQECPEGYGIFDFYPDGTFDHRYVTYGWKAKKEAGAGT
jgi:3',5'-cyclic-AMP phosphodiesterase